MILHKESGTASQISRPDISPMPAIHIPTQLPHPAQSCSVLRLIRFTLLARRDIVSLKHAHAYRIAILAVDEELALQYPFFDKSAFFINVYRFHVLHIDVEIQFVEIENKKSIFNRQQCRGCSIALTLRMRRHNDLEFGTPMDVI